MDEVQVQTFLQTWLYFGTLWEVLGDFLTPEDFVVGDEEKGKGERFLYTGNIRRVMNDWLDGTVGALDGQEAQRERMVTLCENIRAHLDTLYYVLSGLRFLADVGTLAATAVLGESLENCYRAIYREVLGLETPPQILWGTVFAGWITGYMEAEGWCRSTVTRLAMDRPRISLLYYYALLPAPQAEKDHSACSKDSCLALKIDPSRYRTAHVRAECRCLDLPLDVQKIAECLKRGRLPLIEVPYNRDPMHAHITCREDDGKTGFVAISHVWADGLGNISHNSLPACSLQEISRLVSKLPRASSSSQQQNDPIPFWIDTICVPVHPVELKQLALNYLRHPYMHAEHVLVLDNYFRNVDAADCDVLEIFARVSCGNWIGRLWTLQEGRLAKRIWFQFRDKAVELKALWEATTKPRNRGWDYWDMLTEAVIKWNATDLWGARKTALGLDFQSTLSLRGALCCRSVSVPADEALCLFCLAGFDMQQITSVPAAARIRMKVFWSQMHAVPSGLIFSKYPEKLDEPGFRWAPLSFMGALPRNHWAGIVKCAEDSNGVPTPDGLQVRFQGFVCKVGWNGPEDDTGFYFHNAGDWFRLYFEEPWHPKSTFMPPDGPQKMAIILAESLKRPATREEDGDVKKPRWSNSSIGLLGYIMHEDAGIKCVKGLCHVIVYLGMKSPMEQVIFDAALHCIDTERSSSHQTEEKPDVPAATLITKAYFAKHPTICGACDTWASGSSYATGEERFVALLGEMQTPGTRFALDTEETLSDQCWCVD